MKLEEEMDDVGRALHVLDLSIAALAGFPSRVATMPAVNESCQ